MNRIGRIALFLFLASCSADGSEADETSCILRPCHGLQLTCEKGSPSGDVCTEMYQLGDSCRSLASCERKADACSLTLDPKFEACRDCVADCESEPGGAAAFKCEESCLKAAGLR